MSTRVIAGNYVKRTGDTMTGNLGMNPGLTVDGQDVSDLLNQVAAMIASAQGPSGKMVKNADQDSLQSGVETLVTFETIPAEYTDGIEDLANNRFVIPIAGYYSIVGSIRLDNILVEYAEFSSIIKVNTTKVCTYFAQIVINKPITCLCVLPCQYLAVNDIVRLYAKQTAVEDDVDIIGDIWSTFLAVQRVR